MSGHSTASLLARHAPHNWEFVDATERALATYTDASSNAIAYTSADIGKEALQLDDFSSWTLTAITPTWIAKGGATSTPFSSTTTVDILEAAVFASDAGSTDAYAITLTPAIAVYTTGVNYRFKANTANTGAATIDICGLGAKTIVKVAGGITTALANNDIRVGQWVDLVYDGTNMQMQSTLGNAAASGSGTKTLRQWHALDNQPPSSGPATFDSVNTIACVSFSASTDNNAIFVGKIPEGADLSVGIRVIISWAANATSGDAIWISAFQRGTTAADTDSFGTAPTSVTTTTSGTAWVPNTTTIDHSTSEIDSVAVGDWFRLKITRDADAGGDTLAVAAEVIAVEIQSR